jgi:hypothetical protein
MKKQAPPLNAAFSGTTVSNSSNSARNCSRQLTPTSLTNAMSGETAAELRGAVTITGGDLHASRWTRTERSTLLAAWHAWMLC